MKQDNYQDGHHAGWPESPKPKRGWAVWLAGRGGGWKTAKKVNQRLFGPHAYGDYLSGDCPCGCYMAQSCSDGPVDPFGPCPLNPKKGTK